MADEGQVENPGGATAGTIRRVPGNLLGFLTSRIAEYVDRTEGITAEIHEYPGQPAKLVLYGTKDLFEPSRETEDRAENAVSPTNKILVKNFPSNVDEDVLETFFESKKKSGGGPVRNVQLNREKKWALIEFCEAEAVEGVMSRVPITMMSRELDIRPYTPLIQGEGQLENLEVRNLPKELTDDLLDMHIEGTLEENDRCSAEYQSDDGEVHDDVDLPKTSLTNTGKTGLSNTGDECPTAAEECIKESITALQPVQLKMLQMTNYREGLSEQLPGIKVEINLKKNEISFEGESKTVLSGYRNLVETISKFGLNKLDNKPKDHIELYKRERVIEYISKRLEEKNIVSAWEVTDQVITICSQKEDIAKCTNIIDGSITEIKFPISKESSATLVTKEWQGELKQINEESDIAYTVDSDKTSTMVTVVAQDNEVSGVVSRVKAFLESQLDIHTEKVYYGGFSEKFKNLSCLNSTLAHNLVAQVAERLSKSYHVTVTNNDFWYTITGTKDGRQNAKRRIAELDISFE